MEDKNIVKFTRLTALAPAQTPGARGRGKEQEQGKEQKIGGKVSLRKSFIHSNKF